MVWTGDEIERAAGFFPTADQRHLNAEFLPITAPHAKKSVEHFVTNVNTGASTNVSVYCPIHGAIVGRSDPIEGGQ